MDAETPRTPELWIDLHAHLPQLDARPFLVPASDRDTLTGALVELGFRVVQVDLPPGAANAEEALLRHLTKALGFCAIGAGSWAAYSDRLWDLQTAADEAPVAVLIGGLDRLLRSDVHVLMRCVHNLLAMTEAVGLSDARADLQIEYLFTGVWHV